MESSLTSEYRDATFIVRILDEFMVFPDQFEPVASAVDAAIVEKDSESVVLNFEQVRHVSSAVLGKLVWLQKELVRKDLQLRLCGLNEDIKKVMSVTQLDRMFKIFDSEVAAMT